MTPYRILDRPIWLIMALVALFCLLPVHSIAQSGPDGYPSLSEAPTLDAVGENDVAIIVAAEEYVFLPHVPGAVDNGNDWEIFFRQGLGMQNVHVLTDRQAARFSMERFASIAADEVGEGGTLWFVFIGRGGPAESGDDGILLGIDAQPDWESINALGLSLQRLIDILEEGRQGQTVLVVDAGFSVREAMGLSPPVVPMRLRPTLAQTTVLLTAAGSTDGAGPLSGAERPAFSYFLLGALRGWAASDDGQVTAGDALQYTHRMIRMMPGRGLGQVPELFGNGEVVLTRGAKENEPVIEAFIRQMDSEQSDD